MSQKYEIRKSTIHGNGLFAGCDIKKGERILKYLGEKITKEESNRRGLEYEEIAKKTGDGSVYIFELNSEFDIDGKFDYNDARFMNHACRTNCEAVCEGDNGDEEIWFYATRDISKGEELLYNYGYALEHFIDNPCRCGFPECVGYIVAESDRLKLRKLLRGKFARKKKRQQQNGQ